MSDVKFVKGNISQYDNLSTKDAGTLYYIDNTTSHTQDVYLGDKKVSCMPDSIDSSNLVIDGTFVQTYVQSVDTNSYTCVILFTPTKAIASFNYNSLLCGELTEPSPLPTGGILNRGITEMRVVLENGTTVRYGLRGMSTSPYVPNRYYIFGSDASGVLIPYVSNANIYGSQYEQFDQYVYVRNIDVAPELNLDSAVYDSGDWNKFDLNSIFIIKFAYSNGGKSETILGNYTQDTGGTVSLRTTGAWNDGDTVIFVYKDDVTVEGVWFVYYDAIITTATTNKAGLVKTSGSIAALTEGYAFGGNVAKQTFEKLFTPNAWTASTHYNVGDVVSYSRSITYFTAIYVCKTENTDSRWTSSHWTQINFESLYNSTKLASTLKSGTVQFTNILAEGSASTSITMSPAASSDNYQVVATAESTDVAVGITFKDASGFTISVRNLTESPILKLNVSYIVLNT